jgi:hypothetical protein
MRLAIGRRLDHFSAMLEKREPIDDLIDAFVWMRRQEARGVFMADRTPEETRAFADVSCTFMLSPFFLYRVITT